MRPCLVATGYVRDGQLRLARQDAFNAAISRMHNCRLVLRVEEHHDPRSAALLAFYWGVVIRHVTEETGYTDREAHLLMKQLHLPMSHAAVRGRGHIENLRVFDGSITDLDNSEQWFYISEIQRWAAERLDGLVIPDPNQDMVAA